MLSELPSPVTNGMMLSVEDLQQELTCNINIKHRFVLKSYEDLLKTYSSSWSIFSYCDQLGFTVGPFLGCVGVPFFMNGIFQSAITR